MIDRPRRAYTPYADIGRMNMDLITLDFETYYSREYSLSKMTTEEYIRDPQFEVIGVGVKVNNAETEWASGTHKQIHDYLHDRDWETVLA